MGTGENDQKKRKTSVSGKENKKPKLEKNLVKTQEVGGASIQNTQTSVSGKGNKKPKIEKNLVKTQSDGASSHKNHTSVSVWVDQKLKAEKKFVKTQEGGGAYSQNTQTSVSVWVDQKPKTEKLVKTKSDGLQTPPSSPILRQNEFPISLKCPTHENLDEIKSCLGTVLTTI